MATLVSTVNIPVTIKYGKEMLVVAPGEKIKNVDANKVQKPLPTGLIIVK